MHQVEVLDQRLQELPHRHVLGQTPEALDLGGERLEAPHGRRRRIRDLTRPLGRFQQRDPEVEGPLQQASQRTRPDPPPGVVDHPLERRLIEGIGDQTEVGEHVEDLPPLVEPDAADDLIGDTPPAKGVFHRACLGIGAVENGEPGVVQERSREHDGLDLLDDGPRLVHLVGARDQGDLVPVGPLGPERLPLPLRVVLDDGVRRRQDAGAGSVVLFEP